MSDFLSRLAERALGAAPAVQPLLGSRYALPPAAAEPEGFVEETAEREVPRPGPPAHYRAAPGQPAVPAAGPEAEPPLVPASTSPARSSPAAAPPPPEVRVEAASAAASPDERRAADAVPPHRDAPLPPEAPAAASPDERCAADAVPPRRTVAAVAGPAARWVAAGEGRPDADSEALLVARADTVPRAERGEGRAVTAEGAPDAAGGGDSGRPVVRVTIGRIEVRAVHPPAAPQPAREPGWTPPVLSLDEYLRRGSGR